MNYAIIEFNNSLTTGFLNHPINQMDENFYEIHGTPPSGKYAKMLSRISPIANKLWIQSLEIKKSLRDVPYIINTAFTDKGILSFVEIIATCNVELQEFNKLLKKARGEQYLIDYYSKYDSVYNTNVFDILVPDSRILIDVAKSRHQEYCDKFSLSSSVTVDIDDVKRTFNDKSKQLKKQKMEMEKSK